LDQWVPPVELLSTANTLEGSVIPGNISNQRIWTVVFLAGFGWGTGGVLTRVALDEGLDPLFIVAIGSIIAAAAVLVFVGVAHKGFPVGPLEWKVGAVMSVLSVTLPFLSRNLALEHASAGFVGLAGALIPLVTAVAAHFFLADEPLKAATIAGLLVALGGVAVLVLSGDSGIGEAGRPALAGALAMIGVVSVSLGSVYAKRYAGDYSVLGVAAVQFGLGAIIATVASLMADGVPANPSGEGWMSLAYIGLIATFMPVVLYFWLIRHVTVTYSTIIGYIIPLVAVVVGVLVLDEELQPGIVIGGALILAGVIVTDRIRMMQSARDGG
jgi:drug/metabolite transporter (DMT)-like permease